MYTYLVAIWGKLIPERGNEKYKSLGAGICLAYLENSQEEMSATSWDK